jgi:hypothetical protein
VGGAGGEGEEGRAGGSIRGSLLGLQGCAAHVRRQHPGRRADAAARDAPATGAAAGLGPGQAAARGPRLRAGPLVREAGGACRRRLLAAPHLVVLFARLERCRLAEVALLEVRRQPDALVGVRHGLGHLAELEQRRRAVAAAQRRQGSPSVSAPGGAHGLPPGASGAAVCFSLPLQWPGSRLSPSLRAVPSLIAPRQLRPLQDPPPTCIKRGWRGPL